MMSASSAIVHSVMVVEDEALFCYSLEALFSELETVALTDSWMNKLVVCTTSCDLTVDVLALFHLTGLN